MMSDKRNWVITGATGFVGRELVYHLLSTTCDTVTLLCRNSCDVSCTRIKTMLAEIDPSFQLNWNRLHVIQMNLTKDCLGIAPSCLAKLYGHNNLFIHLAASTRFTNTLEKARLINVEGTKNAFNLAKLLFNKNALNQFVYISPAYVQGYRKDVVSVDEPLYPSRTRNTYELYHTSGG